MALLAEKMDEDVFPVGDLIELRGNIPQFAFGADVIEIDGKLACQLFGDIVDRSDPTVEKLGDVPREQVRIFDENPA
jgi:hypothetical protein